MNKSEIMNLIVNTLEDEDVFSDITIDENNIIYISNYNEDTEEVETFMLELKECE